MACRILTAEFVIALVNHDVLILYRLSAKAVICDQRPDESVMNELLCIFFCGRELSKLNIAWTVCDGTMLAVYKTSLMLTF